MVAPPPPSAVYRGWVRHRRYAPRTNAFRYRVFMLYLDLEHLDGLFDGRWLWSVERPNVCWLRRADYLGDARRPLADEARRVLSERLGRAIVGPVGLLTTLRTWGYVQNPVSFYYAYDPADGALEALLVEITNTPWGERHIYALDVRAARRHGRTWRFDLAKEFHVSPFFPMDLAYAWSFSAPDRRLVVRMQSLAADKRVFDATLLLERRPLDGPNLARVLTRHPFITAKVAAAIYLQALRLWLKRVPFHAHPKRSRDAGGVA